MDRTGEQHLKWSYPGSEGQKITCSPSYVDYRSKTNTVILLDIGHTLRENTHGRKRERNLNLNVVDVFTVVEQI
jgi:hypothetical protein